VCSLLGARCSLLDDPCADLATAFAAKPAMVVQAGRVVRDRRVKDAPVPYWNA
jgi:hypothetical protein